MQPTQHALSKKQNTLPFTNHAISAFSNDRQTGRTNSTNSFTWTLSN